MDITMEDVEIAIKVLNEFIKRSREAQYTLRRLEVTQVRGGSMPKSFEDFVNMAFQTAKAKQEAKVEPSEPEPITDEELERMRSIKDKLKGERKTTQP